ncbi:hypothetical protein H310_09722 [Aphanomyces invadans]|uniref:HTH CENPB-type domain-containing protein n=1 Tax=Aphanomyces invadans TaxID=157072 RepID=A0A024TTP4_9STRA|nr:hypothetical protein H310_09722 [Aphanomyces invadans]ETV97388.1 hypothetical protein H310_09722 [Aphanomyces invadans]|eukprot:XP_008874096.1 hypothetical protein H310_09722 [Aphanomyces invadans]
MARSGHRKATGRPSIKNTARTTLLYETATLTMSRKLCIMNAAKDNSINYSLDTYFPGISGAPRKTAWKRIYRWEKYRSSIEAAANKPNLQFMKSIRPLRTSTTLDTAAEEGLVAWVNELRSEGIPVSNMLLQTSAREVANDLGLTESQFRAGSTWVKSFLNRWSLSMRSKTSAGQSSAEEGEAMLTQLADKIRRIVDTNGIELIYNAD